MPNMTPGKMAKELGVSKLKVFEIMQELHINAKRMDAQLSDSQEERLRTYLKNTARAMQRRISDLRRLSPQSAPPASIQPAMQEFRKVCNCCGRPWIHKAEADTPRPFCDHCLGHSAQTDESMERGLERAETHARLFRDDRDRAWKHARQSFQEKTVAYESRAKWRAALVEVVLDHDEGPDGLCWCGDAIPCRTWRKLDEANKGIHRQVEKWSSWNEKRLDEFLYGERRAFRHVIDEDEPPDDEADDDPAGA